MKTLCTTPDAELSADLEDAVTVGSQLQYSRLRATDANNSSNPAPAEFRAVGLGAREPSIYSFSNDNSRKLSKYAEHLKHCLPRRRRSIDSLLIEEQAAPLFMKALEYAVQVGERSIEAIHRPTGDHVELFGVHRLHHGV